MIMLGKLIKRFDPDEILFKLKKKKAE